MTGPKTVARGCLTLVLSALLLPGCARLEGWTAEPAAAPPRSAVEEASLLMREGAWVSAEDLLRRVAARCTAPDEARRALLLLSTLHLDPRNPGGVADSAALMAIRHHRIPGTSPADRLLSEELYVLSLGKGADPGLRPAPGAAEPATPDPSACVAASDSVAMPGLSEEARGRTWAGADEERTVLRGRVDDLAGRNRALEARVEELEAELARIRRLLGAGRDTVPAGPPTPMPR